MLPELAGTLDGIAVRVPVEDGSLTDLSLVLAQQVSAQDVNDAFREAAAGPLKGVLRVSDAPIVSRGTVGGHARSQRPETNGPRRGTFGTSAEDASRARL